ncbi:unnamed protein product [Rotaria sordida]|uniref:Uncharacterized protein n=1 Tax=Rotaria sordida TaxID=392033 RepID=A0A813TWU9_9BILA|nr:unnamed protein product [Rotaria sordida]CAF1032888.1 unnamed protein product [Rotaria sordida]
MSDFYQLTTSTSDFKSRSNDIFDKLSNLEKQHDVHSKTNTPISVPDDEIPSSSTYKNPNIPSHAITFKKRPADDTTFTRPMNKWKKYDLDDVNEHHLSNMGNQHALNDYLRTRVKPSKTNEIEEEIPSKPIFQRPIKKQILKNDDDDDNDHDHSISIRLPLSSNTTGTKTENDNNNDDDDERIEYKLKSIRKQRRGVLSTNEKKSIKPSIELLQEKDNEDNDDDKEEEEDVNDELVEP